MRTNSAGGFEKSLNEKWSMRFKNRHPGGDNGDGIVVHLAPTSSAIRGVRDRSLEACENEILRQNGALGRLRVPAWLGEFTTIADLLRHLMKKSLWPGVETLFRRRSTAFYAGPVEDVSKDGFNIRCYDAAGQWAKGARRIANNSP
jgi:hypothetical protein